MGAIGQLIGGVSQMATGIEKANSDARASTLQYDRERRQADVAIQSAQEKGAFDSGKTRLATSELTAEQKSAYTDSGVDATSGTAAQVQANTAALGELDAQQQSINAAKEAWGYKQARQQAGQEYETRAGNINQEGTSAILGGMSKWVGGAASLAGSG